jgi:diacylglycerol kinase
MVHMSVRVLRSFGYAFAGIGYLFRTQRNARIEAACASIACALGFWLHISRMEWAIIVLMIAMGLTLEGVNSAVEAVVDLASPEQHRLAKAAKDVAAGAVLLAAIASVFIALLIFGPKLWDRLVH